MIYLVTTSPYPYGLAATKRTQLLAEGMNKEIKCKILVSKRVASKSLITKNKEKKGLLNGVEYEYTTGEISASTSLFRRVFEDIVDALKTRLYLKKHLKEGDIVYLFMRDNFAELILTDITHKRKCKCVRELCELPYGTGKNTIYMKIQRYISLHYILKRFDAVFPISTTLEQLARQHCKKTARITKIPILTSTSDRIRKQSSGNTIHQLNLFHAGSLTQQKDGILYIFEALGILKKEYNISFPFNLTGNIKSSPDSKEITNLIKKYDLREVSFLGYISDEAVDDYIQNSSFLIVYKIDNLQNKYCFATKLGDYLKNGKVVITTNVGEQMYYLTDKENCIITTAGDVISLVDSIRWIISNPNSIQYIEKNAESTCIKHFDFIDNSKKIVTTINNL